MDEINRTGFGKFSNGMKRNDESDFFLERFVVGPMAVNMYVVADPATKKACLIDPGAGGMAVKNVLHKQGYVLEFIINTHGHGDHIAANGYFKSPVYIHRLDKDFLRDPDKNLSGLFFFKVISPEATRILEDGDTIELGNLKLEIIHTPGHTPGSISIKLGSSVFTGDALFSGGIGRTDFAYGDETLLLKSIREKLLVLSDDTVIYPGHGDSSTIGEERRSNPFLT